MAQTQLLFVYVLQVPIVPQLLIIKAMPVSFCSKLLRSTDQKQTAVCQIYERVVGQGERCSAGLTHQIIKFQPKTQLWFNLSKSQESFPISSSLSAPFPNCRDWHDAVPRRPGTHFCLTACARSVGPATCICKRMCVSFYCLNEASLCFKC